MYYNPQDQHTTFDHYPTGAVELSHLDLDLDLDVELDFDFDAAYSVPSISSSPLSTQSFLSQQPAVAAVPLPLLDSAAVPRASQGRLSSLTLPSDPMQMNPDAWLSSHGQFTTPKSAAHMSHNRESSLSSLGSAGPASPFSQNTSNPYIAVTDAAGDGYHGMPYYDDSAYHLAKSFTPQSHDGFLTNQSTLTRDTAAPASFVGMLAANRQRGNRGLLPPPELSTGSNRSRPVSVASSIASDSPATPSLEQPEDEGRRRQGFHAIPKLDRTMTDIYADELYSPSFAFTSASTSQPSQPAVSPSQDMFAQRLHAINSQHLNTTHSPSPSSPRDRSPFRHGSPLAPSAGHDFAHGMAPSRMRFSSAQQLREQHKAEHDAQMMRQQMSRNKDTTAPQTISPKDAILEFHEPEGDAANFPLFPHPDNSSVFGDSQMSKGLANGAQAYDAMDLDAANFNNYLPQLSSGLQVPQQYPFVAQPRRPDSSIASSVPSRVSSTESGNSTGIGRPSGMGADGGTYTCTYHGCTQRFETPALLQKHKREGHRQAHGLNGARRSEVSSGPASPGDVVDSQAGPHRCDRINPQTGKPCSTVFSRPYDLTRHEDTIHNARKQKVRCNLCTEDKTFSRADALTRHYRVCHPDVEFPGKHRRRGGHGA